ncbi:MAG: hypothetical protein KAJ14_10925 [Candidatus Omnitrophica bacterium]|nr:hypothetical protein [Candidatus Omnitrophota bacterium]MCK5288232.1 hypothetical protein [Candidatus Omnitrophota bacterium]MCK5393916.1 hypothetical protein [Candidatus Omnitrophota bacterium]MCK5493612.1 hypothetical protein [Candidatus Omnitrophota bacterium]
MKKLGYFPLSLIVLFLVGCSQSPKEVLLDSFEGELNKETVDFGSAEGSSVQVFADRDKKVCGDQSLKIEYNLKPTGYMWVSRGYNLDVKGAAKWQVHPKDVEWSKYNSVSVQMYGSNSNGVIALDLKDKGGEIWRFLIDDDFSGWKEIICPIIEFFPRSDWQPDIAEKNEILDFPLMSFQFEPRIFGVNEFYFDCFKLVNLK